MKHIVFDEPGTPEVLHLADAPVPQPLAGEVRIRVHASGINRADVAQREGSYNPPPGASPVLGLEVSGVVDAVGEGVHWPREGDAVCSLTAGGGYAQAVCVPASHCLPIPAALSLQQAAALPEAAMTVWSNLVDQGRLQPGESLLVHGGTSGIGAFAIALARARGHTVITTVGSPDKLAHVQAWGALGVLYRDEDFTQAVHRLTQGRGVDLVLDMVGGDYVNRNLQCLAMDGRIVQIAFQSGARAELDLWALVRRRAVLTGTLLRPRATAEKAAIVQALRTQVWPLFDDGRLAPPVIDSVYRPAAAAQAHARMQSSAHVGKMLLDWTDFQ